MRVIRRRARSGPSGGYWRSRPSCTVWANDDPDRRFDDLYNLVTDPGFLMMAWERVAGNRGARSAGVDGQTVAFVRDRIGVGNFLAELREQLMSRSFRPLPVKERMIPKPGSQKRRRLGIPTVADRVVQASLKLVLEPIFEADFVPCSYGFRPNRRAHDAIAETRFLASKTYEWVLEGDIAACFDEISHPALMDRVRVRIGDKRVLALVKAFLKAGILTQGGASKDTVTGTRRVGFSRRCWPMWPCLSWTSTSLRFSAGHRPARSVGSHDARRGCPTTGSFGTRMTS